FKCNQCGKTFTGKTRLITHQSVHTGARPYSCHKCGRRFTRSDSLAKRRLNAKEMNYADLRCDQCGKTFTAKKRLMSHQSVHTGAKPFSCRTCGKMFSRQDNCVRHESLPHLPNSSVEVGVSGRHFGFNPYSVEAKKEKICPYCGKCFERSAHLERHKMIHTGEKPFQCETCGRCFNQKCSLKEHRKIHIRAPRPKKMYPCPYCPKVFWRSEHLERHVRIHTGEKPYGCYICGRFFSQTSSLKGHMKTHINIKIRGHLLENNDRPTVNQGISIFDSSNYSSQQNFQNKTITTMRGYTCMQCGKTFGRLHQFKLHQQSHRRKRAFWCTVCGKSFMCSSHLRIHHRTHTGEKPFGCSVCGKRFTQQSSLRVHQRTHSGERPYSCSDCGKTFILMHHLKRHKVIHT
ncbi:hypothetical protein NQD34_013276, partial [Periophthalmus magnuspinnatus]